MMYVEDSNPEKRNGKSLRGQLGRNSVRLFVHEFSTGKTKDILHPDTVLSSPLQELIAIGEAVFEFIRVSNMDVSTKKAFCQLEKQFQFYKRVVELRS